MTSSFPTIEPPDSFFLSAAAGWIELGVPMEAELELMKLSPSLAAHPEVLETRWLLCASQANWDQGLAIAEQLCGLTPDTAGPWLHRAYAMRRASTGSIEKALHILLNATLRFPEEATIPYNLACYTCQLDRLDEARRWLEIARQTGGKKAIQSLALRDNDLQVLWAEIKAW